MLILYLPLAVAFVAAIVFALHRHTHTAEPTSAIVDKADDRAEPTDEDEDDGPEWPDSWNLWWWYVSARVSAHGAGTNFTIKATTASDHLALDAAQAIGQADGAKLKSNPWADVPLLTADALDAKVQGLLCINDADDADEPDTPGAIPADAPVGGA